MTVLFYGVWGTCQIGWEMVYIGRAGMTQRSFVLIYLGIIIVAIIYLAFNRLTQGGVTPSPSASDNNLIFNSPSSQSGSVSPPPSATAPVRQFKSFPILSPDQLQNRSVSIKTAKGEIDFDLYPEATKAASSFIFLANNHFFDGLTFHRVVPNFVVQGGDPTGNGSGGPGYLFTEDNLFYKGYLRGIVAMAKTPNDPAGAGGSQFFIMLKDNPLPPEYVIFGKVTQGMDVVDKIVVGDVMQQVIVK